VSRRRITRIRPLLLCLAGTAIVICTVGMLGHRQLSAPARERANTALRTPAACTPADPCLAVVIDDVGRDPAALRRLLATEAELTFAVLPHAEHTQLASAEIRSHGREILVHLPMMPQDPAQISDEQIVLGRDRTIESAAQACLERIPGAAGANNHMGSAVSQDPEAAQQLARVLARNDLWFLDSRTVTDSQLCKAATSAGVPCLERDVFLDDPPGAAALESAMARAVTVARRRGWAIAIGHPFPATVEALAKWLQDAPVRVVRLSALARTGQTLTWQLPGN
jgi:hypothetical protein